MTIEQYLNLSINGEQFCYMPYLIDDLVRDFHITKEKAKKEIKKFLEKEK